jgi:hypothetical protein
MVFKELTEDLWRRVFRDIIAEEFETIFLEDHVLNTKRFRSEVAGKTAESLQGVLATPSGEMIA